MLQPDLFDNFEIFENMFDARRIDVRKRDEVKDIIKQEEKNSVLAQIHRIIGPFILRRKKTDVDFRCDHEMSSIRNIFNSRFSQQSHFKAL